MIGVAGGTASGKSTVCKRLMETMGQNDKSDVEKKVVSLSQDSFYRELDEHEIILANMGKFNFDHPDAFDTDLMESVLQVKHHIKMKFHINDVLQKKNIIYNFRQFFKIFSRTS